MRMTSVQGRWLPTGTDRTSRRRPAVGDLIAFAHAAWRVMHVSDADPEPEEWKQINAYRPEHRDRYRPYRITLRREHGPKHERENSRQEIAYRCGSNFYGWDAYETDRVPLCSCCGHPWPCRMLAAEDQAERSARVMSERMDRIMPGACYGCGEPITPRQGSMVMPEDNVDIPGSPPPRFHTRQSCADERRDYERRRARALPDAPALDQQEQL